MEEGRGARRAVVQNGRGGLKVRSAIQELAELRKTGGKRVNNFELKEEEAVYDEVDDAEYAKLVAKRREEGGERLGGAWQPITDQCEPLGRGRGPAAPCSPLCSRPPAPAAAACSRLPAACLTTAEPCRRLCDRRGRPGLRGCWRGD